MAALQSSGCLAINVLAHLFIYIRTLALEIHILDILMRKVTIDFLIVMAQLKYLLNVEVIS